MNHFEPDLGGNPSPDRLGQVMSRTTQHLPLLVRGHRDKWDKGPYPWWRTPVHDKSPPRRQNVSFLLVPRPHQLQSRKRRGGSWTELFTMPISCYFRIEAQLVPQVVGNKNLPSAVQQEVMGAVIPPDLLCRGSWRGEGCSCGVSTEYRERARGTTT